MRAISHLIFVITVCSLMTGKFVMPLRVPEATSDLPGDALDPEDPPTVIDVRLSNFN